MKPNDDRSRIGKAPVFGICIICDWIGVADRSSVSSNAANLSDFVKKLLFRDCEQTRSG